MVHMLRKNYSEEWNFFRRTLLRTFLVLSIVCLAMITISYDYYSRHPEKIKGKLGTLAKDLQSEGLLGVKRDLNFFIKIFAGNLLGCLYIAGSGLVPFLFLPLLGLFSVSTPAGLVIAANEIAGKMNNFTFIIIGLLPHGIFEFAAFLYASGMGVYLTRVSSRKLIPKYKDKAIPLRAVFECLGRSFLFVVIPLLLIAAIIETFAPPY